MTPKQERFAQEYLVDLNATQAAIRAGYSAATAYSQGERLLKNAEVAAFVASAVEARAERTQVNADWLLKRLADEAEADVADLYNDDGTLKPVKDWPRIWRQGLVAGVDTVSEGGVSVLKVRLADRSRRLEMIGKHVDVQAFKDRIEHDVTPDLADLIARRRKQVAEGRG